MAELLDTGDLIRHKLTHELAMVACVHFPWLHTCGAGRSQYLIGDFDLVESVSASRRNDQLAKLASVYPGGHRNQCARTRLNLDMTVDG